MTLTHSTKSSGGASVFAPHAPRLRGLLETAWPGVSDSVLEAERIGLRWHELSTAHFAPTPEMPVAHAGVMVMPWTYAGRRLRVAGIHAVCTHPLFQGRGFMRQVMESALEQCDREFDAVALFTLEPELYRKFGFRVVEQVTYELLDPRGSPLSVSAMRALDHRRPPDVELLRRKFALREALSNRLAMAREGVDLFMLNEIMETGGFLRLAHLPALDTIVAFEIQDGALALFDVIAPTLPELNSIVASIGEGTSEGFERVVLHFCPDKFRGSRFRPVTLVSPEYLMICGTLLDGAGGSLDEGELIVPQHARC